MARIAIWSHAASDTVNALKVEVANQGDNLIKIRRNNSTFTGRRDDLVINYGDSNIPRGIIGNARVLNAGDAIGRSSNKRTAFQEMQRAEVKTVEWTTSANQAQEWMNEGCLVYARTQLQGHSGEGIVACSTRMSEFGTIGGIQTSENLARANLFTKGITADRREYRIHVMEGKITYVQQKKRRDGYADMPEYSNVVRNYHTGWIYAAQMAPLNEEAKREALKAIAALGLDYGAVDVITRRDEAWVLEVNTAPGMTGTNLETFASNIIRLSRGEEVVSVAEVSAQVAADVTALQREVSATTVPPVAPVSESQLRANPPQLFEPVPVMQAVPEPRAATGSTRQTNSASGRQQGNTTGLRNNGVYLITVDGERTVGKYDQRVGHFEIIGWEVPVLTADATVLEQLCVL